jgi:AcrR family transcriptional regulator
MKRVTKDLMSKTKKVLLKAAAELVADRGVDAMSIREITEQAKANVAAVNYHFGSREGLVVTLMEMHLLPLWEERMARMDAAEGKWGSKAVPLEELVDAWVRPVSGAARRAVLGEALALRVMGRVLVMAEDEWPAEVRVISVPVRERWQKALVRVLPGVDTAEAVWRSEWLTGGLARMLSQKWGDKKSGPALDQLDVVCAAFVRFACAGLRAGVQEVAAEKKKKGPQATFDF